MTVSFSFFTQYISDEKFIEGRFKIYGLHTGHHPNLNE